MCARNTGWKNNASRGELVLTVLQEGLPTVHPSLRIDIISTSPKACTIEGLHYEINSSLWFQTPPFQLTAIRGLTQLQLITYSCDQGWVREGTTNSCSWFELCILSGENATEPMVKGGKKMVWNSHFNEIAGKGPARRYGVVFNRRDELLRELEVGNVIGVLICARNTGWKNQAHRGVLVARILDEQVIVQTSSNPQPHNRSKTSFNPPALDECIVSALRRHDVFETFLSPLQALSQSDTKKVGSEAEGFTHLPSSTTCKRDNLARRVASNCSTIYEGVNVLFTYLEAVFRFNHIHLDHHDVIWREIRTAVSATSNQRNEFAHLLCKESAPSVSYTLDLLQVFVNLLDGPLTFPTSRDVQKEIRSRISRLLMRLAMCSQLLPTFLFLEGLDCQDRDRCGGGSFADIFRARYKGHAVALKRL